MMTWYVSPYRRISRRQVQAAQNTGMDKRIDRESVLAVDVKSVEDAYEISAMVPGIEADDIDVEILNETISISGKFSGQAEDEKSKILVNELPIGQFSREITLPTKLEPSKAVANLKNGVFTLRVPKAEEDRPKVIKISAE
ncbi:MAG: Hsp20/alpha crystallin family protein [Anaerolineales bacterium]|jgi:HSP20 family protein